MNKKEYIRLLERYMQSWILQDKAMFLDTLADAIDIRECYGASYSTKKEAEQWFTEWNQKGRVLDWQIVDTYFDNERDLLIATWQFHHHYPDPLPDRFDGITVLSVRNGKILRLHEYETKHERFYPYKS